MNILIRIITFTIFTLILSGCSQQIELPSITDPTNSIEPKTYNCGTLSSGAIIAAYYDVSVNSTYASIYDSGRAGWSGISSAVAVNKTNSTVGNPDKYFVGTTPTPGLLGYTTGYYNDAQGNLVPVTTASIANTANWVKAHVSIYSNTMDSVSMTSSERISNAIHEIGHTLRLLHPNDPYNCSLTPVPMGGASVMNTGIQNILIPAFST